MFNETTVTLQGYVGGDVQLRTAGDSVVAAFRVACTPRRFSRRSQEWSDGPTQWYSVRAWRLLGEHCEASLRRGDPVVVHGRVDMRTFTTKAGAEATDVEVEAFFVGHDLSRGTSRFTKAVRPGSEQSPVSVETSPEPDPEAAEPAA